MNKKLFFLVFLSIILSCCYSYSSEEEFNKSKIDEYYSKGLHIVNNYNNLEWVLSKYEDAYCNFDNAAKLGHVESMYHIGYLHEIAANYGFLSDNIKVKNETSLEHLAKASHYYGIASKYGLPKAEEAYIRVITGASKEIEYEGRGSQHGFFKDFFSQFYYNKSNTHETGYTTIKKKID